MKTKSKKRLYLVLLIMIVCGITMGYALLSSNLVINGSSKVKGNTWNIHFDNVIINSNSVALSTGDTAAVITPGDTTEVTYTITLDKPGDFYEFTVEAKNDGSIDGMVSSVVSKLNNTVIDTTHPLPDYLIYSATYNDDLPILENQLLKANEKEIYKVRIEFKKDISNSQLPSTNQNLSFSFEVQYVQADDNAVNICEPVSFSSDDWNIIVCAVKHSLLDNYHVGDSKEIELGNNLGTYNVRIANTSTPTECSTTGFSQSACGFVLEFCQTITTHRMNPYEIGSTDIGNGNIGGWPSSEMRAYLNDTNNPMSIINSLPSVLKNSIIDTTVVSGHGSTVGENNYTSIDKIYLLSTHEVWDDVDTDDGVDLATQDTAYSSTRQLDFYAEKGVTTTHNNFQAQKSDSDWWLRSPSSDLKSGFSLVSFGAWADGNANNSFGVSPTFRIG